MNATPVPMRERVQLVDWSTTPLGAIETWSESLHTLVDLCLDSASPTMIVWGAQSIQIYNDGYRDLLGAKHPRALGQRAEECWSETWARVGPLLAGVLATGECVWSEAERLVVERKGHLGETSFTRAYTPIRDETGAIAGIFVTVAEGDRTKDEFLAMLGHELRNPLAPILTAVELMKKSGTSPRERAVIERQAKHLMRLVDDLLDVSSVVRGDIHLKLAPVRLHAVVAEGIEMASPALEHAHHNLVFEVADDLWTSGDEVRLVQLVANLVTNAAKYTSAGGHVRVESRREDGEVVLVVSDDGIGIAPELLCRVFELFVQGARGSDRAEGGLGLGLALVRTIAKLHGGTVSARSDGPGRGAEFTVRVPAIEPPVPAAQLPIASERSPSRRRKILVVDDNEDAGSLLAMVLRRAGHEVETAIDSISAEEVGRGFAPNVAVLDLGLPVLDGVELGRRLKAFDPTITLIAVTGYGQDSDKRRTAGAGFSLHLVKPVATATLLASIDGAA